MKRDTAMKLFNAALRVLLCVERTARGLRRRIEEAKTRRIGGELIEIPGGIASRDGRFKMTNGVLEIRGTLRPMFRAPELQNQGELPRAFYDPNPRPRIFQR